MQERDQDQTLPSQHSSSDEALLIKHQDKESNNMEDIISGSNMPPLNRRQILLQSSIMMGLSQPIITFPETAHAINDAQIMNNDNSQTNPQTTQQQQQTPIPRGKVFEIEDPNTYSAVVYIPPTSPAGNNRQNANNDQVLCVEMLPLLIILHGAGQNQNSALYEFTHRATANNDTPGDHTNLPPYLLATNQAPSSLAKNFIVVAPYVGKNKRSLYDDPRGNVLSFIKWFRTIWMESQTFVDESPLTSSVSASSSSANTQEQQQHQPQQHQLQHRINVNPQKVYLFGFSEGSTLAVELATTRQFRGLILASYGFTGKRLPKLALKRLQGTPMWIFHSKGDDIYEIACSERLVESLIETNESGGSLDVFGIGDMVKFTKLLPPSSSPSKDAGREHVRAALVASKSEEVYSWLLSLP